MPKSRSVLALLVMFAAVLAGAPANAQSGQRTQDAQTPRRPHIIVRPHRVEPGPNSKRYCRFWLAQEYRVSGPVIVPQQVCWWQ
jgi:hypothetical protein